MSGGSAKAFAHIVVLQVLQEMGIPVDIVTGTSSGAIVGGLYAVGYSPDSLERLVLNENWNDLFRRPNDRGQQTLAEKLDDDRYTITFPLHGRKIGLPSAVVSRQALSEHLERDLWPAHTVADFTQLPTAFGALVTDLATGNVILLHGARSRRRCRGARQCLGRLLRWFSPTGAMWWTVRWCGIFPLKTRVRWAPIW